MTELEFIAACTAAFDLHEMHSDELKIGSIVQTKQGAILIDQQHNIGDGIYNAGQIAEINGNVESDPLRKLFQEIVKAQPVMFARLHRPYKTSFVRCQMWETPYIQLRRIDNTQSYDGMTETLLEKPVKHYRYDVLFGTNA